MSLPEEPTHGDAVGTGYKNINGELTLIQWDLDGNLWEIPWDEEIYLGLIVIENPTLPEPEMVGEPPTAVATASVLTGDAPLTVDFDGTDSSDPDGTIAGYFWHFGDGDATDTDDAPSHEFEAVGTYLVTLTVTDDDGNRASDTLIIEVDEP